MSELTQQLNCYILAGGKSSRMGEDKGLMILNSKMIIEHVITVVKPLFKKCVIVSANETYAQFGIECIPDLVKDIGPAGGILSAIHHSKTEQNFIVSCDMPFISAKAVEFLISEAANDQITVPVHEKQFEPLFAVYSRSCLEKWEQEIQKGLFKLQNIISNFKTREVNVEGHPLFPKELFTNINTKEDLENAIKKMRQ